MNIQYIVKEVKASTQYRRIKPSDQKWVLDQLREIINIVGVFQKNADADDQPAKNIVYKLIMPNKNIPRQGRQNLGRMNSILSAAEGIVDNFENGTQYDFSNHTCAIVQETFSEMKKIFPDWELVSWTEVTEFSVEPPKPILQTTIAEIFDLSEYEMVTTFRKKTTAKETK